MVDYIHSVGEKTDDELLLVADQMTLFEAWYKFDNWRRDQRRLVRKLVNLPSDWVIKISVYHKSNSTCTCIIGHDTREIDIIIDPMDLDRGWTRSRQETVDFIIRTNKEEGLWSVE